MATAERAQQPFVDGVKLRELREAREWSQAKLAAESGVGYSTIQQIESGRLGGSNLSRNALAAALGVTPKELGS